MERYELSPLFVRLILNITKRELQSPVMCSQAVNRQGADARSQIDQCNLVRLVVGDDGNGRGILLGTTSLVQFQDKSNSLETTNILKDSRAFH